MPASIFKRQYHNFVLRKIIFGQPHASVEDREHMVCFQLLRLRVWTVALQAQAVWVLRPQQMIILSSVRLVAGRACLFECGLMQKVLFRLFGLIAVASQANIDGIGLRQAGLPAGMWIVTIGAVTCCSRMLYFRLFNLFRLIAMASHAKRFDVGLREHHFSVFCWRVAGIARLVGEWRMQELPH